MSQKKKRRPKPMHFHGTVQFSASEKRKTYGACIGLCAVMLAAFWADTEMLTVWALFALVPLTILFVIMILRLNESVIYDDDGFVYRSLCCRSKRIEWAQITQIEETQSYYGTRYSMRVYPKPFRDIIITADGTRIRLDGEMENLPEFGYLLKLKCADRFVRDEADAP